jgi:hypothetical protein
VSVGGLFNRVAPAGVVTMPSTSLQTIESPEVDIRYAWGESYDAFRREAQPLIERHWNEVGSHRDILRLNIDHDRYLFLEKSKIFHLLTARDRGHLIGYFGVSVIPYPRDKDARLGVDEFIYAMPEYRRHYVGLEMVERGEKYLGELGCHIVAFREKVLGPNHGYLKHLGFEPQELVCTKILNLPHAGEK